MRNLCPVFVWFYPLLIELSPQDMTFIYFLHVVIFYFLIRQSSFRLKIFATAFKNFCNSFDCKLGTGQFRTLILRKGAEEKTHFLGVSLTERGGREGVRPSASQFYLDKVFTPVEWLHQERPNKFVRAIQKIWIAQFMNIDKKQTCALNSSILLNLM